MTDRADALLSGPRGRRLCAELLATPEGRSVPLWRWQSRAAPLAHPDERARARDDVRAALATTDLTAVGSPGELVRALQATVDTARYWQEPDVVDEVLADDEVAALLRPVAAAVVAAPASRWWATSLDPADQQTVVWEPADTLPRLTGSRPALHRWREHTEEDERRAARERPTDPRAAWSGEWWSTPITADLVVTTRTLPGLTTQAGQAAVRLVLAEDELGWQTAATWPVPVPDWARVLEITGPQDWSDLVRRHPLWVTASRRHDWWRVTGSDGPWLVPDWSAVVAEFDAVHLTVDGYLSTAGRALPVELPGAPAYTVLSGWDPDAAWWVTDLFDLGEPTYWRRRDDDPPRWAPA
ncbi:MULTISPECIES: hypothetical protein [unclassified Modestobacter]|uniref:hypothetical protein n=1 Tax=unclassified Modestobacter TaxID=2643866 RepID=UPI0022AA2A92|nr:MULTISPECIES: hypothetical protein [unclassified Modestobacter]MCZ2825951.1 hypothetical protein [Modestobacter sp. VKM Ac-2981]MCZ2852984.1 hypothetical protein [Modestobacter sp. VKM Ac-2982]